MVQRLTHPHSTQQDTYRPTWWSPTANQADELDQRRSTMQCRWLHHKLGYSRRQQGKDCSLWCPGSVDEAGKVKGHARPTECYWRSFEHDSFRYYSAALHGLT